MQVLVEETKKLRRASASIRDGGMIHVKVPRHWSRDLKRSAIEELVERLQRKDAQEKKLLDKASDQARITITTQAELERFVRQVNADTFNAPLGKVQLGYSRYNHLAQVNLRTKTMTVSKFCLQNAPVEALRYLIIHELAHYYESGHGPNFWALVGQHVPDYRLQSRIMKAFHHQAVIDDEKAQTLTEPDSSGADSNPSLIPPAIPPSRPRRKSPYASPPRNAAEKTGQKTTPAGKKRAVKQAASPAASPEHDKTGLIPDFVKQLQLWINR